MTTERTFAENFRALVDRICENENLSRKALAEELGVHIHSLSNAAYRGEIGFDLIRRLARRAGTSAEELYALEKAWIAIRRGKPKATRLHRSMEIIDALTKEILRFEAWLQKRGELEEYRKWRKSPEVLKRLARELREES